ncbi:hypothetical protein HYH03_008969 [Edaphochlamys debaryana]|uniref:assimilatory sulfite reductase (ferredoxin) n=1 Tax=Edaphochlamys debaryana TaxID=47281 RepID=A0A835XZY7_9CHLO|nr:hypothetical protein HYH03_008969 [Edaphochlamys debaryana]|eukprot:KAG2492809.1 hypothetical protein HYH03_008969 [Edaphochlamys debaryana]
MQALTRAMRPLSAPGDARLGRGNLIIPHVAGKNPASRLAKRSKVELIKENSDYLRHPLMEELVNENTFISEDSVQLMKFHGSYMQDDREKRSFGSGKAYSFLMRTKQPAGLVDNRLYLVMDELANQFGNGTLRLTTRQTYQLHGVLKHNLKTVFSTVIKNMGSTLATCGDVNRNVMGPAAPFKNRPDYMAAQKLASDCADLLAPQSGAYYDMWLDGEKFVSVYTEDPKVTADRAFNAHGTNFENSPEPIYGAQFLPRKFKIAVTVPGDNSVDLFTNDLGIVVIMDEADPTKVRGYNLFVGGGMGRTRGDEETFPRLADPLGFVAADDIFHAVKAVVAVHRDYGRRDNRKQARLKYVIAEWGLDKFRTVFEQYFGKAVAPSVPLPAWEYRDYLGWGDQGDGKLYYGIYVQNGRVKGEAKKALRAVIERFGLPVTLTPHQNIILRDVDPAHKAEISATLAAGGLRPPLEWDSLDRLSMACPALPLCGLAVTESERALPDVNKRLRASMAKVGLPPDQAVLIRMTGCPNGCVRTYVAELAFVGDGPNSYQVWLGGNANGTRLAVPYQDRVKVKDLEAFVEPLFTAFRDGRGPGEAFGDWAARLGVEGVRSATAAAAAGGNGARVAGAGRQTAAV